MNLPIGPENGHTFEISIRMRGSSAVVDGPYHDSEDWSALSSVSIRAWSLAEALERARDIPLAVWLSHIDGVELEYED